MKAYKVKVEEYPHIEHIMIIKNDQIYIVWSTHVNSESFYEFVTIDQFKIKNMNLIDWEKVIRPIEVREWKGKDTESVIKLYKKRNSFELVEPEQLLTHHNPILRDFVKELTQEA